VLFRTEGMSDTDDPLWWRLAKDRRPQSFPSEFGIAPVNILLLY